jgi:hypothetical protein
LFEEEICAIFMLSCSVVVDDDDDDEELDVVEAQGNGCVNCR